MDPGYTGHRPRVQMFHGSADTTINPQNFQQAILEWTNVLGLGANPTSSQTGVQLGTHQATRQQWQNACGYLVLDTFLSMGGDHGPSDALFLSQYVIPFLGLDKVGAVDPEIAQCGNGGAGGNAGAAGATGSGGAGGLGGHAGHAGQGGAGTAGAGGVGAGGRAGNGGAHGTGGIEGSGGFPGTGGQTATGGAPGSGGASGGPTGGVTGTGTGGLASTGGANGGSPGDTDNTVTGCSCALAAGDDGGLLATAIAGLLFGLATLARRRRGSMRHSSRFARSGR